MVKIDDGIVCKECNFDIYKLYNYLYSRNFNYLVDIVNYERNLVSLKYEEDYSIDKMEKSYDLIRLVGLLHSKTSYNKEISRDKYLEVYELINNNIMSLSIYYSDLFDKLINIEYMSPSEYLFLNNYYVIDSSLKYCSKLLDEWKLEVSDKVHQRVAVIHNNLSLDHYIKNTKEYLISFDNYIVDSPFIDLYKFYRLEWKNINFKDLYNVYSSVCKLSSDEEKLMYVMVMIPDKVEFTSKEKDNVIKLRDLINYLVKSFELAK